MLKELKGRRVCSMREAAELLGVTRGRVHQLVTAGRVWSEHVTPTALVLDRDEIARLAKERNAARAAGRMPGPPGSGFPGA